MAEAKDNKKTIIAIVLILGAAILGYFLFFQPKEEEQPATAPQGGQPGASGVAGAIGAAASTLASQLQPGVMNTAPTTQVGVAPALDTASLAKIVVPGLGTVSIITQSDKDGTPVGAEGWNTHVAYIVNGKTYLAGSADFNGIKKAIDSMGKPKFNTTQA